MKDKNAITKEHIFNPEDKDCPICDGLKRIFTTNLFETEMEIPETIGQGYCRRINLKPSMKIVIGDMTFHEMMVIGGKQTADEYRFAFCLGKEFLWRAGDNKREFETRCGESYIFNRNQSESIITTYLPGNRIWGVTIELDAQLVTSLMEHGGKPYTYSLPYQGGIFSCGKISSSVRLILHQILDCHYQGQLKKIYLEGKLMELTAVYLNEVIFGNPEKGFALWLSACDVEALRRARCILDETITSPPTIGKLAKLICLNEYKLKKGFKELFGMPVHAYIIDKRLEMARLLMEEKKLRVTEAALLVGYNDLSYFAEKFRQKYGINPSEYSKR